MINAAFYQGVGDPGGRAERDIVICLQQKVFGFVGDRDVYGAREWLDKTFLNVGCRSFTDHFLLNLRFGERS